MQVQAAYRRQAEGCLQARQDTWHWRWVKADGPSGLHLHFTHAVNFTGMLLAAGFSVVKLAIDKQTGKEYACKIMALPPVGQEVGENENTR